MNILLLGSGGREHALAWKIAASPLVAKLWCAPGNAGIAREAECVALDVADHAAVIEFCRGHAVDLVVVGPETPLAAGIVDDLAAEGIKAFGPSRQAAQLEGSKGFTKDLCSEFDIPTGAYRRFDNAKDAVAYVRAQGAPIVVKADGLAAGKGVVVAQTLPEAEAAIAMMFEGAFGSAGAEVVIEEFLSGREISFFALCDGETAIPLASAQDHKRVFDHDKGPNTGGMGAYSPTPFVTGEVHDQIMARIILPTVAGMKSRGTPFKGVLYAGVMLTAQGPKLFEYNVRFGDPECQVLMLRMMSDIVPALLASIDGQLKNFDLRWYPDPALTVVMAAKGYPGDYIKGARIDGLDDAAKVEGVEIFHAGTVAKDGAIIANGGRVLNVCAMGKTVTEARDRAYQAVDRIKWPDGFCRRDIAWQAVEAEKG
ncbi:phosphoribosylamine--glycine ligase [Bradyrhizobium japonicum]|jgi:phosphoribosylamine---glycine ligase|uniref:Phosphoribosylamine--glycine ligase n=1 Tax=Bradyrhizobium elkanii TaxID=29448 RepID=A0ABV4ESW1_BRAEL|nr:phosphoribosylamine--glycine ligase [Bradyrhizobium elkanii]MBP2429321.1 phosphoribosylamine--glycine ligase [Bradyrhizobium elkanii]MCP1737208.1 phosphoribosylamine--glycine ligase [Bradyrhizobium elkanii]MCP1755254.1 phosphoribosylamine--glycine ligase [Bradyrhizobium elkanii]MCP1980771.1 phosphoribosylamine--glycine ligase [Bradyrhizobium elkanii]MCS3572548.1 phosphoribosylamine--glycine ligase [Bradyrhizobium elkanii]